MSIVLHLLRKYWAELIVLPPFMVAVCYYLYGDAYLASWSNAVRMTLPWLITVILGPIGCHWWRRWTLQRFPRIDDWKKRIVWGATGFLLLSTALVGFTFLGLQAMGFPELIPTVEKLSGLLFIIVLGVLISVAIYEGITYFQLWKEAITETEEMEKLTLESQFRSLQSQLNPHFLFNSFNVLSSLISESPERAERFVDELSNVYRYLLRSNEQELASIGQELRFIRSYFHLLKTRHEEGVALEIRVSREHLDKKLPALALQILVENAIKHNEISLDKPLKIEILDDPSAAFPVGGICVCNNLQRKAVRFPSNQVGLDNLRQRYELLGLKGFAVTDDGNRFKVALPFF
jgi:hypothetical protein